MISVAFDPIYIQPLPENHRFPMEKYDLLPRQLLHEGTLEQADFFAPSQLDLEYAHAVHCSTYLDDLIQLKIPPREQRVSGFPHNKKLIERELTIMEGTRKCTELALKSNGIGLNIAGGTHHAFTNRGEGFCLLNDQAIAAQWLLNEMHIERILIIDLDVHQGNGTAEIFQSNSSVFTFSMHGASNYPLHKEKSDLDIELPDFCSDSTYLDTLKQTLPDVIKTVKPQFVFYQCGVDILETDKLGKLSVSMLGCKTRDAFVLETIRSLEIPLVCSMGGGYSPEIKTIVEAHANTFRLARMIY
jgi:acetoin utilization deacetylase AcuC-like enzyme